MKIQNKPVEINNYQGCKCAEIVEVIKTTTIIGTGKESDPVREVVQYWDKCGNLIAEK